MLAPVSFSDGGTALTGQVARPKGPARAAVLVLPSILNNTPPVEAKAHALAEAGYLALVADFYGQMPDNFDHARDLAMEVRATVDLYRQRLRANLRALAQLPEAAGLPIGAIGFCMGGQAALELAREGAPLFAAVSFHGLLGTDRPAEKGDVRARILVCHGDADPLVPRSQVIEFWEEMDESGANWHFHSYSGVKHSFTNPAAADNSTTGYDASADRQSWAAMHALFDEVLGEH